MNALDTELLLVKAEIRASIVGAFPSIAMNRIVFGDSAKRPHTNRFAYHENKNMVFAKAALSSELCLYVEANGYHYDVFLYWQEETLLREFCHITLDKAWTSLQEKICSLKVVLGAL